MSNSFYKVLRRFPSEFVRVHGNLVDSIGRTTSFFLSFFLFWLNLKTVFFPPVLHPDTDFVDVHFNSHTHNTCVLDKSAFYFLYTLVFYDHSSPITVFTNLVILADNLWNVALSRHFCIILLQLPKSGSKARWQNCSSYNICLIGRNKKKRERKTLSHFTCHAAVHRHMVIAIICQRSPLTAYFSAGPVRPKFAVPCSLSYFSALSM